MTDPLQRVTDTYNAIRRAEAQRGEVVMQARAQGHTIREIAIAAGVTERTIIRLIQEQQA